MFPGAVCPSSCNFGRVHGSSPARGSVTFKGQVTTPIAQQVTIQVGASVFFGFAIKGETTASSRTGANTTFSLVDYRDRLLDVNHKAQYNMIDEHGAWWHILPEQWFTQVPTYVRKLNSISDFEEEQELPNDLNELTGCMPMLTAGALINYLAFLYHFTVSSSSSAGQKLSKHYPENLDFNSGRKVAECLDAILEKSNLQWTVWGNLNIHITEKGVADNLFEQQLLAGNVNLCALEGYIDASIGHELNDKGRRVVVVGGREQHETWFPCRADWNQEAWTWDLCNNVGFTLSALLAANGLTELNQLKDLPERFHDKTTIDGLEKPVRHNGKKRNDMAIKDYIEQICWKVYRVDFGFPLKEDNPDAITPAFTDLDTEEAFDWEDWNTAGPFDSAQVDTVHPTSSHLPSDATRQFFVKASSRKLHNKGQRDADEFAKGIFAYINDGASLDQHEYIVTSGDFNCKKLHRVCVQFSDRKFSGTAVLNANQAPDFTVKPDQVYIKLSLDTDVYIYTSGEEPGTERVREIVRNYPDLRKSFIDEVEVPLLSQNILDEDFLNHVFADDIAKVIAQRLLSHEFITTAGHITFRGSAGFMPSGIIESVNVTFDAKTGTREVINFTNTLSDDRIPNFFSVERRSNKNFKGEDELRRRAFQEEAKKLIRGNNVINANVPNDKIADGNFNALQISQVFGGEGNAANVSVDSNMADMDIGELMIVKTA